MIEYPHARRIADMLAAVGEPTRMRILHRLTEGPAHVGLLAETVGVPMVNMSHHLGVLRQAGLLEDAKDGRRVVYTLHPDLYAPGGPAGTVGVFDLGGYRLHVLGAKPKPAGGKKAAAAGGGGPAVANGLPKAAAKGRGKAPPSARRANPGR